MKKIEDKISDFGEFVEKNYKVFFAIILALAVLLNTYKLGEVPSGIDCDEAGMNMDAYYIANYGVDRFCKKNPVYFINFGDGQNALYTYLNAFILKLFKVNNYFTMRLPALILSIIEVVVCYLLVKEFRSKKEALLFMLLVTISPWHIMKSRWALESYLLSPMLLFSIYLLVNAIKANKHKLLKFAISGLIFGITLYTYAISYIIIPIFLLLMLLYLIRKKQIKISQIIVFIVPLFILALPLILMLMVQHGWIDEINSFITIPKLLFYRGSDLDITNIFTNLKSLKEVLWCDTLNYNSLEGYGTLYYFGTIAMIIGTLITIIKMIKQSNNENQNEDIKTKEWKIKKKENINIDLDIIMLLIFASNLILAIFTKLNANRLNGIYISATYFELVTLRYFYKNIKVVFYALLIAYLTAFMLFIKSYFFDHADEYKPFWDNGAVELMTYLNKFEGKMIHADNILYIYNLYANKIPPEEFNKNKVITGVKVSGYNNYDGRPIDINDCNTNDVYVTTNLEKARAMVKIYKFEMEIFNNMYYILY